MSLSQEKVGWDDRNELVTTKDNKQAATERHSPGLSPLSLSPKAQEVSALKSDICNCS